MPQVRERSAVVAATPQDVLDILTDAAALPAWNPAIRWVEAGPRATAGTRRRLTAVAGLRGSMEYLDVGPGVLTARLAVPGMAELSLWWWRPVERGVEVTHLIEQSGVLAAMLSGATVEVPQLRLDRLRARLEQHRRRATPS